MSLVNITMVLKYQRPATFSLHIDAPVAPVESVVRALDVPALLEL